MSSFNPSTTWIGLLGGGISGSILAGGSIYQIDLWHMGGNPIPVRAMVKGKRVGVVAETGTALAALIVTGCATAKEMEGLTSSGLDWEFSVGLKASNIVKAGAGFFKTIAAEAVAKTARWATHEPAKKFVQWSMNDLNLNMSGKNFYLIPSPVSFGIGAGIFYEWQTLNILAGKIGWQHIKPKWSFTNSDGGVKFKLRNIPEQDGEQIRVSFVKSEWGFDPIIRWKKEKGVGRVGESDYHIIGYSYGGELYEQYEGKGMPGINVSNFLPIGQLENGVFSVSDTSTIEKNTTVKVYPEVMRFGNYPYWTADDTVKVTLDSSGRFKSVDGSGKTRN